MTDNTRELLDAAAAVLGLPPGLPPIGERRRIGSNTRKVCGYNVTRNGEVWVFHVGESGGHSSMSLGAWDLAPLADAQSETAPGADDLPRVVEWSDLQPGDLALDVHDHICPVWRQERGKCGTWRAAELGFSAVTSLHGHGSSAATRAVLIARNVPKRASAIRAAYEAMRERALEVGKDIPRRGT